MTTIRNFLLHSIMCFPRKGLRSCTHPIKPPKRMPSLKEGCLQCVRNVSTTPGFGTTFPHIQANKIEEGPIRRRDVLGGIIHDYYRHPPNENLAYG